MQIYLILMLRLLRIVYQVKKKGKEEAQIGAGENRHWRAQGCIGSHRRRFSASWRLPCHDHFLLACGLINFFIQVHFFGFRVTGIDEKGGATRLIMCVCVCERVVCIWRQPFLSIYVMPQPSLQVREGVLHRFRSFNNGEGEN